MKVDVAAVLECAALIKLRPDMADKVERGEVELQDTRAVAYDQFLELVTQAVTDSQKRYSPARGAAA